VEGAVGRRWSGGDRVGGGEGEEGFVYAAAGEGEVGFGDGWWQDDLWPPDGIRRQERERMICGRASKIFHKI
jgi:hypothetical protein